MDAFISTFSGAELSVLDPQPEDIHIDDIAQALSLQCRFGGHVPHFYSVAQHSVMVSNVVPEKHALWGLLHDASEAYIADILSPIKWQLPDYQATERRFMAAVCERFAMAEEMPPEVKAADLRLLATEKRDIKRDKGHWQVLDGVKPLGAVIMPLSPEQSRRLFMMRYRGLVHEPFPWPEWL